jgi:hypothetical protein
VLLWPNLAATNHFSLRIALVELEAASLNDDVEVERTAARFQDGFREQVSGRESPGVQAVDRVLKQGLLFRHHK